MAPPRVRNRPGRPPMRRTPKGLTYAQGRPHPSDPDYEPDPAAIGGIIAGLFLWPVAVNWLRGGQAQAIGWFGAKFFNEPYGGGGGGSAPAKSNAGTTYQQSVTKAPPAKSNPIGASIGPEGGNPIQQTGGTVAGGHGR